MINIAPFVAAQQAAQQALRRQREEEENRRRRQQLEKERKKQQELERTIQTKERKKQQELERTIQTKERKDVKTFDIYEEGFCVMEGSGQAHYVGSAEGTDFLDACKNYIAKNPNSGYIKKGNYFGKEYEYACSWGCRWFPTLAEAQASFG